MGKFRSIIAVTAAFIAIAMLSASPASAVVGVRAILIGLPAAEWQRFASDHVGAFGLGAFPDSRDPARFFAEIGAGSPSEESGSTNSRLGALWRSLSNARIGVAFEEGGPTAIRRDLEASLGPHTVIRETGTDIRIAAVATSQQAQEILDGSAALPVFVFGIGDRTPVWIEICPCEQDPRAISGGIARRPMIVTPYDLARTIYDRAAFPGHPTLFTSGNELHSDRDAHSLSRVRSIAASLDRDAGIGHAAGGVTVPMSIAAAWLGVGLVWFGRNRWAIRAGLASWAANVGYIVALFVPTGSGILRALVMLAVMALAACLPVRGSPRTAARYAFAITSVFWAAALLAPLRPGGFPATAIWGNPLVSWRFFGLQNFEAGLLASGVVVWGVIAGLGPRALAVTAVLAGFVIAAPTIGANYVGVLTFAFGVVLAIAALARRRIETWHVVVAGIVAAAAFVLSLLADAGSPVSHGGRAARRISQGGISVVWDFVRARMRLNLDLIRSFPIGTGFLLVAMMLGAMAMLFVYGTRTEEPWVGRVAVWAGAAMALSSLVLEDSGFYSGAVIFVIAVTGYIVASGTTSPAPPGGSV